jgi:probable phosphoglycerate mutase
VDLTARGEEQARAIGRELAGVGARRVLASDLRRAWRTAELAWEGRSPAPVRVPALRERHAGAWEGAPIAELSRVGAMEVMLSWAGSPPGGESQEVVALRAMDFLASVDDGSDTVVFAHGGLIRCVVGLLDGVDTDHIGRTKVGNVEVAARSVPPGTFARLGRGIRRLRGG